MGAVGKRRESERLGIQSMGGLWRIIVMQTVSLDGALIKHAVRIDE